MARRRSSSQPKSRSNTAAPWAAATRCLLIVLAGVLVYSNSLSGPFVFDDESSIVSNPAIRSLNTVLMERKDSPIAGRPVVGYSLALNFLLGGVDVSGYHLANIAIHIGCALLLFGIAHRTLLSPRLHERFGRAAPNLAMAIALLWVVHPLNTEAVNYITQRTESLMAFFYLATLYASVRAAAPDRSANWQFLAIGACALGMGCKESMVSAPLMVLLYDRIFVFNTLQQAFARRWGLYAGLATTWIIALYLVLPGPRSNSAGFSAGVDPWTYLMNQAVMIVRYLRLAIWPSDLAIHYGAPVALSLGGVLPQAVLVVAMVASTIILLGWKPAAGFLGAWFFVTLAPSSSFIPIATEVGAERRMYLPLMAIAALVIAALYDVRAIRRRVSPRLASSVLAVAVAALGTVTFARNRDYATALLLAQTSLTHWPSDVAHGAVGTELQRLHRDEEAIFELRLAARTDPLSRYNLGVALFNSKRFDEAIEVLGVLADKYPMRQEAPLARRIRGHSYLMLHKWPEAITELRMTLAMTPYDKQAQALLASSLNSQGIELGTAGKHHEAVAMFRRAVEIDSSSAAVRHNLATALLDSGDTAAALAEAQRNVTLHPTDAASYDLIGRALAMQGEFEKAIVQLEQARRLSPDDPAIREDLERVVAARKQR